MSGRKRHGADGPRDRLRFGFAAGNTLALAVAIGVASLSLWPVYQSPRFIVLVAVSFGLGTLIAILGAFRRWPAWIVGLITVCAYLLAGVPLAIPSQAINGILPSVEGAIELLAASALSWKQLVTITTPVGAYQALLVPAFILVLLSSVVGLSIALRSRVGELAVLAPAVLFLAGIVLGPSVASSPPELGLGLFVVLLFWLLLFRWQRRRNAVRVDARQSRRTIETMFDRRLAAARGFASAALIIAVAIAAGTAAMIAVPSVLPRDVLRTHVQQPFDPRDYPSPLSGFRGYLQPEHAGEPLLRVEGLPEGGRLRIAALDTYDGIVYSVGSDTVASASGAFTRLPYKLDQSQVDGERVAVTVTVDGYSGVWVPGTGQLEQIDFQEAATRADSFYYNDNSATGVVLGGLQYGDRYRSVSIVPRAPETLAPLRPGTAVLPPVGVLPDGLTQTLESYVDESDPPGVQLQAMLDGLKTHGYVSHGVGPDEPFSRSGHGADRITQLLIEQPMLGDAEQYAVAAALMARQLGFPARVVVGFVPDTDTDTKSVTVTGRDISAWIEVQTEAEGWVAIDPNPVPRDIPERQPDEPTVVPRPQSVLPPPAPDSVEQRNPARPDSAVEEPPAPQNPLLAFLLAALAVGSWVLIALFFAITPFVAIVAAKLRRRRLRRGSLSPGVRTSGGWREFEDTALDFGVESPPAATRIEFAGSVGAPGSLDLASVVDRAVFSPGEPSEDEADDVWRYVAELRASLRAGKNRRQRLHALISLRSLGRYSGRVSGRAKGGARS